MIAMLMMLPATELLCMKLYTYEGDNAFTESIIKFDYTRGFECVSSSPLYSAQT
jgi:hypothetical protein